MPTTDTSVPQVVVNKLTKAQYDAATKSPTEFYAVTDATISYNDLSDKPTIPAAQVNSDWSSNSGVSQILNKPNLATVATSGSYNDLLNKPTIPAAQVNSDWNANSGVAQILNKPTIPTVNDATLTITQNGTTVGTFTANQGSNATVALTDTTYSDFVGTDGVSAGAAGLVPAPATTDAGEYLKADGTWDIPTGTTYTAGANVQISAQNVISATDTTYSNFTGSTSSTAGSNGLVPAPAAGDQDKYLKGDGTWAAVSGGGGLVEMNYGESNAWAKFIAAYQSKQIVYCRASSNANPASGSQTRKAFMAYVNNADNPTSVEFQYVRSVSSKTASQPVDQVFVYTLTNASGGTWSVTTRDMGPKLAQGSNVTVSYSSGTYTISATGGGGGGVNVVQTTGQSTTDVMSQKAVTDIIGNVETILQTLNSGNGAQ